MPINPKYNFVTNINHLEPLELQKLKQKLANLNCECHHCIKSGKLLLDEEIQVDDPKKCTSNQFTQADLEIITRDHYNFLNTLTKDVLCPSCFLTMNLLRGGSLKILKDQESETQPRIFSCDKATAKTTIGLEKSTLISNKLDMNVVFGDDYLTDGSSDVSFGKPDQIPTVVPEPKVKFRDIGINEVHREELIHGHSCLCLEKFIDSIRPPLTGIVYPQRR